MTPPSALPPYSDEKGPRATSMLSTCPVGSPVQFTLFAYASLTGCPSTSTSVRDVLLKPRSATCESVAEKP
ncbi:hypothetical protein D3C83_123250 [compost metagenome]